MQEIPFQQQNFKFICQKLEAEKVFIFPSDTSYGFSASPFSQKAIQGIQQIKKRSAKKPFLLLVADFEMAQEYGTFSQLMKEFAETRWKEEKIPTTVLVPKTEKLSSFFPEFTHVGLRVPIDFLLRKFLKIWGKSLISTSANISGNNPIFTTEEIKSQFSDQKIWFANHGDLSAENQSEIWNLSNTKLVRVR